jgi:hypothetical protein
MLTLLQSPNGISHIPIPVKRFGCIDAARLMAALCLLITFVTLATGFEARAVLISTGDGTGNTTPPSADPGFDNVGSIAAFSGVYVGNGWVLTANHVGENPIVLLGVTYDPVMGSGVRFRNPDLSFADLKAYKLLGPDPPLPALVITDSAPTQNTLITIIGNGRDRGSATTWSGLTGWNWGSGRTIRWGTNKIADENLLVLGTQAFSTVFDKLSPGQAIGQHEADVANGDSGGAAFTGSSTTAELIGILFARGVFADQPNDTSLMDTQGVGNLGFIVDLFAYRNDILAIIDQPDCNDGLDDDGDGLTDFPDDPGCIDEFDTDERGASFECDNGIDDDADGLTDFPDDDGCLHPTNPIEAPEPGLTSMLSVGVLALCALRRRATRPGASQSWSSSSTR